MRRMYGVMNMDMIGPSMTGRYLWSGCVKPLVLYCPRDPHASDLWRMMDQHFERIRTPAQVAMRE